MVFFSFSSSSFFPLPVFCPAVCRLMLRARTGRGGLSAPVAKRPRPAPKVTMAGRPPAASWHLAGPTKLVPGVHRRAGNMYRSGGRLGQELPSAILAGPLSINRAPRSGSGNQPGCPGLPAGQVARNALSKQVTVRVPLHPTRKSRTPNSSLDLPQSCADYAVLFHSTTMYVLLCMYYISMYVPRYLCRHTICRLQWAAHRYERRTSQPVCRAPALPHIPT